MLKRLTMIDKLDQLEALIGKPEAWCKGPLAKRSDDSTCQPIDDDAVCWCAMGAVMRVEGLTQITDGYETELYALINKALPSEYGSPVTYNEARMTTHADIRAMLARARELASCA